MATKRIATHNGIDFYPSLEALLEDGKQLRDRKKDTIKILSTPGLYNFSFVEQTGLLKNLKMKTEEMYEKVIENLSKIKYGDVGKYSILIPTSERIDELKKITFVYSNNNNFNLELSNSIKEARDGYIVAFANLAVPYTILPIKSI